MPGRRSLAAVLLTLGIGLLVVLPAGSLVAVLANEAVGAVEVVVGTGHQTGWGLGAEV